MAIAIKEVLQVGPKCDLLGQGKWHIGGYTLKYPMITREDLVAHSSSWTSFSTIKSLPKMRGNVWRRHPDPSWCNRLPIPTFWLVLEPRPLSIARKAEGNLIQPLWPMTPPPVWPYFQTCQWHFWPLLATRIRASCQCPSHRSSPCSTSFQQLALRIQIACCQRTLKAVWPKTRLANWNAWLLR